MNPLEEFKNQQKQGWAHFAPLESVTMLSAAVLVQRAGVRAGQRVLDVATGTGVVALTAARRGARVSGLDFTPELLERARENAWLARVEVDWREGDLEQQPYPAESFDVVLSQFGQMFAPRPAQTVAEMLRVLVPGGTLAFSTWPPELFVGRLFALAGRYLPAPPDFVTPPWRWGEPQFVAEQLGDRVQDLRFDRETVLAPALSPQHHRALLERTVGPLRRVVASLGQDPARLEAFRAEYEALASEYFADNTVRQGYLITRATKRG